ncbi:MAG: multicopper oxidase domain-containing protein [Gemmatimonadota bacterium]|nr:multicopper oxidase domain-containing protein [Gemmatimonadota bacterium]
MPLHQSRILALIVATSLLASRSGSQQTPEPIRVNDNLHAAGTLRRGVLNLSLDTRVGMWHPDGDAAPGAPVPAFGETGRPLQIPGPLIRVRAGTEIVVSVKNSIADGVLTLHGLVSRPISAGSSDSVQVNPGASREIRFRLDAPGTYYYWGTTTGRPFRARTREDAQLSGAIVVEDPAAPPRRDRVLVIGEWADTTGGASRDGGRKRERVLLVVNGRSWPHTTRLSYKLGETVHWRVINTSADLHPMHLHGFYFRVDSRGDGASDTTYAQPRRDLVVTDLMRGGSTMSMTWVPERAGSWLFHCHIPSHMAPRGSLGMPLKPGNHSTDLQPRHVGNHALQGMNGLVVGIHIAGGGVANTRAERADAGRRRLRLLARPSTNSTDASPIYTFSVHEGGAEPPQDSASRAGTPIVLTRGVPVGITVVNNTSEPTAVHWHGIELESYFDGVAGFSGRVGRVSPVIAPADSFEVRFTPPRAGTFMYHTHIDEGRQQPAGLAGALIVVDPERPYDPATETAVLITSPQDSAAEARAVLLNGKLEPAPIDVRVGVPHRLRLMNITAARPAMRMELRQDTTALAWRMMAKDGAELPAARQASRPARQQISIGETYDVEFTPTTTGILRLEARTGNGVVLLAVMPIRVVDGKK